ncbi:MAG: hypothetical protein ABIP55_10900 [Tepidisphaeraceae bacterium]
MQFASGPYASIWWYTDCFNFNREEIMDDLTAEIVRLLPRLEDGQRGDLLSMARKMLLGTPAPSDDLRDQFLDDLGLGGARERPRYKGIWYGGAVPLNF